MPSTFLTYLKKNQPISALGALVHTYCWFSSINTLDEIYLNPAFDKSKLENTSEKEIAIYCVHGTADFPWAFKKIATRLIKEGLDPRISSIHLIAFEQRYKGKDICFFARQLVERIKKNEHKHVILMGHSRGGIINAYAAEYYASEFNINVGAIISICSPFGGSYLANKVTSYISESIAQMADGSVFLNKLNDKIAASSKKYFFIAAQQDSIVAPLSTFNLDYIKQNPGSFVIYDRHGHLSILSSHRLVEKIVNFLDPLNELFIEKERQLKEEGEHICEDNSTDKTEDNSSNEGILKTMSL